MTKIATRRNEFFRNSFNAKNSKIIEIGAFDNPTFLKEENYDVNYLDYFSKEELIAMHKNNTKRNFDNVVEVDHVVKSSKIAETVGCNFDVVVANHVIEHIPNLVGWFRQISRLLSLDGVLLLSVPDKRYTFDYFRPV
ncbi:MAG TPA: class I SAM-dependent methyltransferase, partial [Aestuariivirgaceae bacterium]|nr:class I SAM-dependent methyltransferase [Aestuariivirgaceae bacterium]